jgi:hypothetical protein
VTTTVDSNGCCLTLQQQWHTFGCAMGFVDKISTEYEGFVPMYGTRKQKHFAFLQCFVFLECDIIYYTYNILFLIVGWKNLIMDNIVNIKNIQLIYSL